MTLNDLRPNRSLRNAIEGELRSAKSRVPLKRPNRPGDGAEEKNDTSNRIDFDIDISSRCFKHDDIFNVESVGAMNNHFICTSVAARDIAKRVPSDVVIVVDVSGTFAGLF
jgi:hypothetical protein